MTEVDGVVVVDKPAGMTSHDVVDEVRRRLGVRKVGHAGTLDPDATGVLVIGVGRATRFLSYAQTAPKRYVATARFGVTTTTQDASGEVVRRREVEVTADDVARAAGRLEGELEQVPPMVSAVKVGGERLYRRARRGEEIERTPRRVTVSSFSLVDFSGDDGRATFEVVCSSGTYVRTLVHDLGELLGCGAHVVSLRRLESGGFTETDAISLEAVDSTTLRPLSDAVRSLPKLEVDETTARVVAHGRPLDAPDDAPRDGAGPVALVRDGELLAVYRRAGRRLVPERVVSR